MATLSVTTVTTGNATTDHTISTGNTAAADIILYSNGYGMALSGNSTTNTLVLVANGNVGINNNTPTVSLTISANAGAASAVFNGGNTFIRLASNGIFSEPAMEFAEAGFSPTAKIASKNEGNAGGSLYFITRDTSSTSSTLTNQMRITGTGNVIITSNTLTLGTSTLAANGYTTLPNGMKMNWGVIICNTISSAVFTSAFTTNAISISVTPITASIYITANTVYVPVINNTAAQIRSLSTTTTATVYFMAIGY